MAQKDSPEEFRIRAAKIAAGASLRDLRLTSSNVSLIFAPDPGQPLDVTMNIELAGSPTDDENTLLVSATFKIQISAQGDGEDSAAEVANLEFSFVTAFSIEEDCEWDEDSLEAFAHSTGIFAIYPYAREYATDITTRLGLPPLILDFLKR